MDRISIRALYQDAPKSKELNKNVAVNNSIILRFQTKDVEIFKKTHLQRVMSREPAGRQVESRE